jgi:hypothetical protein
MGAADQERLKQAKKRGTADSPSFQVVFPGNSGQVLPVAVDDTGQFRTLDRPYLLAEFFDDLFLRIMHNHLHLPGFGEQIGHFRGRMRVVYRE